MNHEEVIDEAVASTCTKTGLTEGKHCSVCEKVLIKQNVIPMKPHTEVIDAAFAPTCTETGLTEGKHCAVCETVLVAQEIRDALDHDLTTIAGQEPTCTEDGWTEYDECSRCNYTTYEVLLKLDHLLNVVEAQAPTCTDIGWNQHEVCLRCDYTTIVEIDAWGHTDGTPVVENNVEPDCLTKGSYDSVVYCTVCGEERSRESIEVDALRHSEAILEALAPTCTEIGLTEGLYCDRCKEVLTVQQEIPANGHKYESSYTDPTFDADGYTTYVCSICDDTYTEADEGTRLVAVAAVNGERYETLAEAIAAAQAGDTVTLLMNASGDGFVIDKPMVLDLGGFTYTISGNTVGSAGAETLGIQILPSASANIRAFNLRNTPAIGVVIMNGEINTDTDDCKMLIQNYANLTLTDVHLDGTGSDNMQYVLSNNSGEVNISGDTNITAPAGAVALDVCKFMDYDAPVVNVNTTGTIIGEIEVSTEINENLHVSGGQFTQKLDEAWCADGYVPGDVNQDGFYAPMPEEHAEAMLNGIYYTSLADALAHALEGEVVFLVDNIILEAIIDLDRVILDLNGYTIKGTIMGTFRMNGGTLITAEGVSMAGPVDANYLTTDAVFTVGGNNEITIVSGTVTLGNSISTLKGQILTLAEGATFVIPEGMTLDVYSTVFAEGILTINGTLNLASAEATVTAAEGLTLTTNVGDKVWYTEGCYVVHDHTEVIDAAKEATCTETGLTEGKHCSV